MKKIAVVTGAGSGIGHASAFYFAGKGYDLALFDRSEQRLVSTGDAIRQRFPVSVTVYPLDVSNAKSMQEAITDMAQHNAAVEVLFNNAGIIYHGSSTLSIEDFDDMMGVNLRGVHNLVHYCTPLMKQHGKGYIFNLASIAAQRPVAQSAGYCMSKYGVLGYSKSIGLELLKHNIKVTALCPSVVNTSLTTHYENFPDEEKIQVGDILHTVDYLMHLNPQSYIDEITLHSTYLLRQ